MEPRHRRDAGRPRGKPIEQAILHAALDDLAAHGLDGVNIDRIAAAAQVNKTTVYRRWPTREALVAAALEDALRQTTARLQDQGSLRLDLQHLLALLVERISSAPGQALVRAGMSERAADAVRTLSADPLVREPTAIHAFLERAAARGEWDTAAYSPDAVLAMLTGAVIHRLMLERQPITPRWTHTLVEVIARGVRPSPPE